MMKQISENIKAVLLQIEDAADRVGREPGSINLLAATKNRSPEEISEAVAAGVRVAGENRVQELLAKARDVRGPVEWHFIGHLQRNKARQVVGLVRLVHSVDSLRLAREIDRLAEEAGLVQEVLVQVNVASEESKNGVAPDELKQFLDEAGMLRNIDIRGLSTIAPLVKDQEEARWVFRSLAGMGRRLQGECGGFSCRDLSMGMTNDFEVAVEEGSTYVRIGTGVFGPR